jgi:hypothetical protein
MRLTGVKRRVTSPSNYLGTQSNAPILWAMQVAWAMQQSSAAPESAVPFR